MRSCMGTDFFIILQHWKGFYFPAATTLPQERSFNIVPKMSLVLSQYLNSDRRLAVSIYYQCMCSSRQLV